jgi:hypothetical protein
MFIREILGNLRRAYQRAVYQIDEKIRNGWGLDDYVVCLVQEVKIFCERDLEYLYKCSENSTRLRVFKETLKMIKEWEECPEGIDKKDYLLKEVSTFIMKHQGWYWN